MKKTQNISQLVFTDSSKHISQKNKKAKFKIQQRKMEKYET